MCSSAPSWNPLTRPCSCKVHGFASRPARRTPARSSTGTESGSTTRQTPDAQAYYLKCRVMPGSKTRRHGMTVIGSCLNSRVQAVLPAWPFIYNWWRRSRRDILLVCCRCQEVDGTLKFSSLRVFFLGLVLLCYFVGLAGLAQFPLFIQYIRHALSVHLKMVKIGEDRFLRLLQS
jgi:hypothetical protein